MTLRKKILGILILAFSLISAAIFFIIQTWKSSLREGLEGQANVALSQQANILSDKILDGRRMLRILAMDDHLADTNIELIRLKLRQWSEEKTLFESFYYDTMESDVYPPTGPTLSVRDRDYFPRIQAGKEIIGAPIISRHTGKAVLLLTSPVRDIAGQLHRALAGTLMIQEIITRVTSGRELNHGANMYLFDTQGRALGSADTSFNTELEVVSQEKSPMAFALWMVVQRANNPKISAVQKTKAILNNKEIIAHFISIPELHWYLVHTQSVTELMAPMHKALIFSFSIIALLFYFAGYYFSYLKG